MARMRTIDQAAAYIRERDPETALTATALRRLVKTGEIPSVRVGAKYLIALEPLEDYLSGSIPAPQQPTQATGIRPIQL